MTRNTTIRLKLATSISYKIWQTVPWRTCIVRDVEFQHRSFWIGSHADLWLGSIYILYPQIPTKFMSGSLMLLISNTLCALEPPIPSHAGIIYGWSLRESERDSLSEDPPSAKAAICGLGFTFQSCIFVSLPLSQLSFWLFPRESVDCRGGHFPIVWTATRVQRPRVLGVSRRNSRILITTHRTNPFKIWTIYLHFVPR